MPYDRVYAELLADMLQSASPDRRVYVYNRSFSGATITSIGETCHSDSFFFGSSGNDVMILQCGIVDCAPRPLPGKVRSLLSRLPEKQRNKVVRFIHRNRARILSSGLSWKITPPQKFAAELKALLAKVSREFSRVYVINIAPTTPETDAHSPGLSGSLVEYNAILQDTVERLALSNVTLIDVHRRIESEPEGISRFISQIDGHHITPAAHQLYADAILEYERKLGQPG